MSRSRYSEAGVNIDAGQAAVQMMKAAVQATYNDAVLSDTGSFGGLFDISALKQYDHPVLVASTDGVGTKTMVAARMQRWNSIGQDLVNHCINDILVQGARPLFFMDYVASSHLEPETIADIVSGMADACKAVGCVLLGGETAEMPGVYAPGEIDVAGTIVGVVDREQIITGAGIEVGDVILNLPSSGLHTNGYSLARKIVQNMDWHTETPELGESIGDALLKVHRCYLEPVEKLRQSGIDIHGLAHITGGGVIDNLPRILPEGVAAVIQRGSWQVPPIFGLLQRLGDIEDDEIWRVFNMGLGMLVIVPPDQVDAARTLIAELNRVGEIVPGKHKVTVKG